MAVSSMTYAAGVVTGPFNTDCYGMSNIYGTTNTCDVGSMGNFFIGNATVMGNYNQFYGQSYILGEFNTVGIVNDPMTQQSSGIAVGFNNTAMNGGLAIGMGTPSSQGAVSDGGIAIYSGSERTSHLGDVLIGGGSGGGLLEMSAGKIIFNSNVLPVDAYSNNKSGFSLNSSYFLGTDPTQSSFNVPWATLTFKTPTQITNVLDGVALTDAATVGQLNAVIAGGNPLAVVYTDAFKTAIMLNNTQVQNAADATSNTDLATWGQVQSFVNTAITSANTYTDTQAAQAVTTANTYTDTSIAAIPPGGGGAGVTQAYVDTGDANTLATANTYTDTKSAQTLTSANAFTDNKSAQAKTEAVAESKTYTDTVAVTTLSSANTYTDNKVNGLTLDFAKKEYVDSAVSNGVKQANNYTDQKFEQSKEMAYSAAALAMASAGINFNPNVDRQMGMAVSTVNGQSSMAFGVAWKSGRGSLNIKGAIGGNGMSGVSVGYTMAF
jgi:hypothetical protein